MLAASKCIYARNATTGLKTKNTGGTERAKAIFHKVRQAALRVCRFALWASSLFVSQCCSLSQAGAVVMQSDLLSKPLTEKDQKEAAQLFMCVKVCV